MWAPYAVILKHPCVYLVELQLTTFFSNSIKHYADEDINKASRFKKGKASCCVFCHSGGIGAPMRARQVG